MGKFLMPLYLSLSSNRFFGGFDGFNYINNYKKYYKYGDE